MEKSYFESTEKFWDALRQFNVLYGGFLFEWKPTTARKEHEDLFNVRVEPGDTYFRKDVAGLSYDSALKLSRPSMEKLLYAVIGVNPSLGTDLQELLDQKMKDMSQRLSGRRVADSN
jgi:hypothetical protein